MPELCVMRTGLRNSDIVWCENMRRIRWTGAKLHKENGGFSLVELIIVIAIISVLITTAVLSVSLVFSANAKTCANDIQRAVADCKVTTMGKSRAWLVIYRGSDGQLYGRMHAMEQKDGEAVGTYEEKLSDPEKLGGKRVSVTYTDAAGIVTELPEGESGGLTIEFDRSSGSFKDGTPKSIEVIGGNRHYELKFEKLTGKITVKQL